VNRVVALPRYFFHVHDGRETLDEEGTEFPDADQARAAAVRAAGEALRDLGGNFWRSPEWRMWVTDESGATLCTLTFSSQEEP
jgi:hypothetical protein